MKQRDREELEKRFISKRKALRRRAAKEKQGACQ